MELYTEILCQDLAAVLILNLENQKFSNSWGKWERFHFYWNLTSAVEEKQEIIHSICWIRSFQVPSSLSAPLLSCNPASLKPRSNESLNALWQAGGGDLGTLKLVNSVSHSVWAFHLSSACQESELTSRGESKKWGFLSVSWKGRLVGGQVKFPVRFGSLSVVSQQLHHN